MFRQCGNTWLSWNDGHTETYAFTQIDRSLAVGASLKGTGWGRADDAVAIAVAALSSEHRDEAIIYVALQMTRQAANWNDFTTQLIVMSQSVIWHPADRPAGSK